MQFILIARDKPGALTIRQAIRPQHLEYLKSISAYIVFAGPIIDKAGEPCGSVIVYDVTDREIATHLIENDPYAKAGLFGKVEILAFRTVVRNGVVTA